MINGSAMSEIGDGWYKFMFDQYIEGTEYVKTCDGGSGLPAGDRYVNVGFMIYKDELVNLVWNEIISEHTAPGSAADTLSKVNKKLDRNMVFILE